jgi:cellulose synthase/poly-beta-1,6-N-acetylglucosamine synthase-like glycosyltransferase/peptidoglycan/xylan/chitin deacetylase (PgdA/CDA1 family)
MDRVAPPGRRVPSWMRTPPSHWRLLAFAGLIVLGLLAFQGFALHTGGPSGESAGSGPADPRLVHARPVLAADGDRLTPIATAPGRRVALTFDDGPDPRWTPQIARVLREAHVPATFFMVGTNAARHPDVVRAVLRDGNEIGNHTFTHTSLSSGPLWQRRAQLELTETTLLGITGRYARFLRPPYSSTPDALPRDQEGALARLAGRRYYVVLTDFDSQDWQRPGVREILRRASPPGTTGGVVMFHDGGGDRSQTVAAVRAMIPRLRARGFRFVSLSELTGLPRSATAPAAGAFARRRAGVFATSVRSAFWLMGAFSALMVAIGVLVAARVVLLVTTAVRHSRRARRLVHPPCEPPSVSVIVPAYNEAVGIERAVRSLAASDHERLEIVVVDDGSSDETAEIVAGLGLDRVRLIRQDNGGKSAALNTGVAHSTGSVLVMVDGDTLFERETISRLVAPLADARVGAVSGNTKVGNRSGLLGRWQHIEYVMGFNLDRRMYETLQCTPTVPGAIGAFRREVLESVGGVPGDTLAEDTDLTLAIGRTGSRVVYVQDARAWTEAPATLTALWRQRYRWSFGTMQAVWKHRGAVLTRDPREARIGRRALPYMFLFQIVLPIIAPVIDLYAIYGVVFSDPGRVLLTWTAFNVVQLAVAAFGFRLDGESLRPLWALPLQQFVYRQLMYLVIIESTVSALKGARSGWKHLPRTGDITIGAAPAEEAVAVAAGGLPPPT